MTLNCEIIADLLPLYSDGACSPASESAVEEHLRSCENCRILLKNLRAELPKALREEKDGVLKRQRAHIRRLAGGIFVAVCGLVLLISLIVVLAQGEGWGWLLITTCSLLLAASVTALPLLSSRNRFCRSFAAFLASIELLLWVTLRISGKTFFPVVSSAVLFGLTAAGLPIAFRFPPLRELPKKIRPLLWLVLETMLYALMMYQIGLREGALGFDCEVTAISAPAILYVWLMTAAVCFLPGRLLKTGAGLVISGGIVFFWEAIYRLLSGRAVKFPGFYPRVWNAGALDGNLKWCVLLGGLAAGSVLFLLQIIGNRRKK